MPTEPTPDPWADPVAAEDLPLEQLTGLLAADLQARWDGGCCLPVEAYLRRWPRLADSSGAVGTLAGVEFRLRHERGESPRPEDYARRFPDQPPDLTRRLTIQAHLMAGELVPPDPGVEAEFDSVAADPAVWSPVPGYDVLEELGRGGAGVVYLARQQRLGRVVALKTLPTARGLDPDDLGRFRAEGVVIAQLQHPNVVAVYDVGEHDGLPFLSIEYCPGGSLADLLTSGPLAPPRAAALVEGAARGAASAHAAGIVHRDLTPGNILLAVDGTPKITDFHLAKWADGRDHRTRSGTIVGTPAYMAPEQTGRPGQVGPATDVYALGAVLYHCLTGRPPFAGCDLLATIEQVRTREPDPPRGVPRDLATVCLKCLEKDPRRRYATAAELAADLRRFLTRRPISARPVRAWGRAWRWCRRNPAVAGLLAGVIVSLAAGTLAAAALAVRAGAERDRAAARQGEAERERAAARRVAALSRFRNGVHLCERGKVQQGILELVQALALVPADDTALIEHVRSNTAGWAAELDRPELVTVGLPQDYLCAISPDGKRVLVRAGGSTALLIDTADARVVHTLAGHSRPLTAAAFSPDGRWAATGCEGGAVRVWDVATGTMVWDPPHGGWIGGLAFSPDGTRLVVGSDTVVLYDVARKEIIRHHGRPEGSVTAAAFDGRGETFLTAHDGGGVRLWSGATGRETAYLAGHGDYVTGAAFSLDGRSVVTATAQWTVHVWDVATCQERLPLLPHENKVLGLAFAGDGVLYTACLDGKTRRWDIAQLRWAGPPLIQPEGVSSVGVSRDGKTVWTVGGGVSRTWRRADTGPAGTTLPGVPTALALGPRADVVAVADGDRVRLFDARTRADRWTCPTRMSVTQLAFSPGGRWLVAANGKEVTVRDAADGTPSRTVRLRRGIGAVSPDGSFLFTGRAGELRRWPISGDGPGSACDAGSAEWVNAVAVSPDGRTVAVGSRDQTVALCDAASGRRLRDPLPHGEAVMEVVWSPDGRGLLVGGVTTSRLWSLDTGRPVGPHLTHSRCTQAAAFSPDGRVMATGHADGAVRAWDVQTGRPLTAPARHRHPVADVGFEDDGRLIVCTTDGAIFRRTIPPPVTESPEQVAVWAENVTGMTLDPETDVPRPLQPEEWQARRWVTGR